MPGIYTNLVTGANTKIKINGASSLYINDISYALNVQHLPVEVMGMYEVAAYEPIGYTVSGSFSCTRYTKDDAATSTLPGTSASKGNGPFGFELDNHLNPGGLSTSTSFEIEITKKTSTGESNFVKLTGCRVTAMSGSISKRGLLVEQYQFVATGYSDGELTYAGSFTGTDLTGAGDGSGNNSSR